MVFGLGGTQELSLPMMTVLRRFPFFFARRHDFKLYANHTQVLNTHDDDWRVLHLEGAPL